MAKRNVDGLYLEAGVEGRFLSFVSPGWLICTAFLFAGFVDGEQQGCYSFRGSARGVPANSVNSNDGNVWTLRIPRLVRTRMARTRMARIGLFDERGALSLIFRNMMGHCHLLLGTCYCESVALALFGCVSAGFVPRSIFIALKWQTLTRQQKRYFRFLHRRLVSC